MRTSNWNKKHWKIDGKFLFYLSFQCKLNAICVLKIISGMRPLRLIIMKGIRSLQFFTTFFNIIIQYDILHIYHGFNILPKKIIWRRQITRSFTLINRTIFWNNVVIKFSFQYPGSRILDLSVTLKRHQMH